MGLLEELIKTENLQGEELDAALYRIKEQYNSEADKEVVKEYLTKRYDMIEAGLKEATEELDHLILREQLKNSYDILPISYIAKTYFNKSASWLYQRLNGNKVRGRVYTLNEKEKEVFNHALQDIAKEIGSISIV